MICCIFLKIFSIHYESKAFSTMGQNVKLHGDTDEQ